jgi:mono/diheme cytochrome c family protein
VGGAVVAGAFALAQAQVFEPSASSAGSATGGDVYRGELVFERECSGCHGIGGVGGSPGPRLVDTGLDAADIATAVEQGRGVMPPALVSGQDQADVVAYVVSIAAP